MSVGEPVPAGASAVDVGRATQSSYERVKGDTREVTTQLDFDGDFAAELASAAA